METAAENQPVRNLTARQIGERLGRDARAVLYWVTKDAPPCPCTTVKGRGGDSPRFNLDEVSEWLRFMGRPVVKVKRRAAGGPGAEAADGPDVAPARAGMGGDEGERDREMPLLRALYDSLGGDVDFDLVLTDARITLRELRSKAEGSSVLFAPEIQQLAGSFKSLSGELRALEEARFKKQQRDGEWVKRETARSMLTAEASMFTADLQTLAQDLPRAIVDALAAAGTVGTDQAEAALRIATAAARLAVDKARQRRADAIGAAIGRLDATQPVGTGAGAAA